MRGTAPFLSLLRGGLLALLLLLSCGVSAAHLPSAAASGADVHPLSRRADAATSSLSGNATNAGVYSVTPSSPTSLSGIASLLGVSLCSLARLNRIPDVGIPFVAGEGLLIPIARNASSASSPAYEWPAYQYADDGDRTSCVVPPSGAGARTCVYGGAHTYTAQAGDTLASVAAKLNLTQAALLSTASHGGDASATDVNAALTRGSSLKVPQCGGSSCRVRPYRFTYGTYVDLAERYGATVGQLMGANYGYNHSDVVSASETPVITLYYDCKAPAECEADTDKCDVIS